MKILLCDHFWQPPESEYPYYGRYSRLLESRGHDVIRYDLRGEAADGRGRWGLMRRTRRNGKAGEELRSLIRRERPAILHCTNMLAPITPLAHEAAQEEGIPSVQSVSERQLFGLQARAPFAESGSADKGSGKHRPASVTFVDAVLTRWFRQTWVRKVSLFLAASEVSRQRLTAVGLPPARVAVEPVCIDPDPGPGQGNGHYALYVGRLSADEGFDVLLAAWKRIDHSLPLWIVGDGPMRDSLPALAEGNSAIRWLPDRSPEKILAILGEATCLVVPSLADEASVRTIVAALSRGTPAIAPHMTALAELLEDGKTGWYFRPGNATDLSVTINRLFGAGKDLPTMRRAVRERYQANFTAEVSYGRLMDIYGRALAAGVPHEAACRRMSNWPRTAAHCRLLRYLPRFRQAYRSLGELADREQWSRSQIEDLQLARLNSVWADAILHVPYYRDLRAAADLPTRFVSLAEFREAVPLLSRQSVQVDRNRFLSGQAPPGRWRISGGSTGLPTAFFWSKKAHCTVMQAKYRYQATWGLDIFDRFAFLWGHTASFAPGLRGLAARWTQPGADRLRNRIRLSAYQLGSRDLQRHLQRIDHFQPAAIYGYSTAIYLLAVEAMAKHVVPEKLKAVILTAEPTPDFIRDTAERAFGVPAVIEYGAAECDLIAAQWPDGTLRVREDIAIVETLPREDNRFDIVLTVLVNPAFPLLRYVIGDVTDAPLTKPPQGFAILKNIAGRHNDFVWSRAGDRIHPTLLMSIIGQTKNVRRYQVWQSRGGAVRVSLEPRTTSLAIDVAKVTERLHQAVGGFPVTVEITRGLALNRAGKHRWIVSDFIDQSSSAIPFQQDMATAVATEAHQA